MSKVKLFCYNRFILVDEDQVKKHIKKDELVNHARQLQKYVNANPVDHAYAIPMLEKAVAQIVRLNRTIRQNVQMVA